MKDKVETTLIRELRIVGYPYLTGLERDLYDSLKMGDKLSLHHETENAFDEYAVRVEYAGPLAQSGSRKLGYVPKTVSPVLVYYFLREVKTLPGEDELAWLEVWVSKVGKKPGQVDFSVRLVEEVPF